MQTQPLISVVTPVYNGERFLRAAYDCLVRQAWAAWEWVVVDDGSTDATAAILGELASADGRVRWCSQPGSGSCKLPRDRAVFMAKGEFVVAFDVDDQLSDDYLDTMLKRQQVTNADIVYPQMLFIDEPTGRTTLTLPDETVDARQVYEGRQLVKHTMPSWSIGCNGGLYRRSAWRNSSWPERKEPVFVYSDEVDERIFLIHASRVSFSTARYYYLNYAESMTGKVSPRKFHLLRTSCQLKDVVADAFGRDSKEYRLANTKLFHSWRWQMAFFMQHHRQLATGEDEILQNLRQAFNHIEPQLLTAQERRRFLGMKSYRLLFVLFALKYSPSLLLKKTAQRLWPSMYRWMVVRPRMEKEIEREIEAPLSPPEAGTIDPQSESKTIEAPSRAVGGASGACISMFCGNASSGGLADRLRGAVSVFMACQQTGRQFKLYFTHPFRLTDYLQPASYDWRISDEDVCFDPSRTQRLIIDSQADTRWEHRWQEWLLRRRMRKHPEHQLHVYTNAGCCYDHDYAAAFEQLFRPTPRLQQHLDELRLLTGDEYITVSARFCHLLDDFNEEVYGEPLSSTDREALLVACMEQMATLRTAHPGCRIVACSDSTTFLARAQKEHGAVVIPGHISHIGNDGAHSYEYYEKTLLDFYVIAQAQEVYLLRGPAMHQSGFPYAAARAGRRPFHTIKFKVKSLF